MALDPENLRAAMRAWTAGVTVATTVHEGHKHGMTVNSFTSISLDPAMITISLQQTTRTHEFVSKSRVFGLRSFLRNNQEFQIFLQDDFPISKIVLLTCKQRLLSLVRR